MARRGIDWLRHARRRPVASTVIRGAQIRPAFHDPPRALDRGHSRIVAPLPLAAARFIDRAARALDPAVILIPVGRPSPDVAGHVIQTVAVWRKGADWRGPLIPIVDAVL